MHLLVIAVVAANVALPLGGLHWRSIGPAIAGGRVAAVAGTDSDPNLYFAGAAGGGVFRTTNGGATWLDVFGHQPVASIGALAVAPSNPRIVWVGTGEATPRNDTSYGDGVWQSRDGGRTWRSRGLTGTSQISKILIHPKNPDMILVGALGDPYEDSNTRGLYRTVDGGRTWRRTLFAGPESGVADLAWAVSDPKVVFAAIWQFRRVPWSFSSGGERDGLYRSLDGGMTWRQLRGRGLPRSPLGRIGVSVAPSDPRRVYALIESKLGTLWRSDDGGDSWSGTSGDTLIDQRPFYMSRLAVDPSDENHVFFLSENLVQSFDGGRTFSEVNTAVHQDHHDMWISHDGLRMIEANDGGAPISMDRGRTWDWRYNVSIGQIYHVGYDLQIPYHVCRGLQDNDSYCGPSDSLSPLGILASDWRDVGNDGDGSWAWPDPNDPNLVWNVGVNELNGQLGLFDLQSRQNYDVSPYVRDTNGAPLAGLPYRFGWEAPIAFSNGRPARIYFGGNVLFASSDRGRRWDVLSPDLTRNERAHQQIAGGAVTADVSGAEFYDTITTIAPSPLDDRVLWVGADDGLIHITRDGGRHWQDVTIHGVRPFGRIAAIEASPSNAQDAFAVVDRHLCGDRRPYVFATRDGGVSWKSISANLPHDQYAHVVRQDPRNADVLYAGLEQGIYVSFDRGSDWRSLQLDMATSSVRDMQIQPQANDLIVATHGRGFWILDDLTALQRLGDARRAKAYFFAPRPAYAFYRWWSSEYGTQAAECCASQTSFAGENPAPGATISFHERQPAASAPRLDVVDGKGNVIRRLTGPNRAGVNRFSWDLSEEPPLPWKSARPWNLGPSEGAPVFPGSYAINLVVADRTLPRTIAVRPDPRSSWTQADYEQRRDFVRHLDDKLSAIDGALNELDRLSDRERQRAEPAYKLLTSNPRNSEDALRAPDALRERVMNLIGAVSLSQGPPTPAQGQEAAQIDVQYAAAMARYRAAER
ncbi:MAG: hypothetical protein GIX02_08400 [Candidatus Eremiobacteraeota bacterium]|nr:hypothetical protein [Candidatus Eremiobacteraeota bacterium]